MVYEWTIVRREGYEWFTLSYMEGRGYCPASFACREAEPTDHVYLTFSSKKYIIISINYENNGRKTNGRIGKSSIM